MNAPLQPRLLLTPLRAGVPAGGGTLDVLVRVQAPPRPEGAGAPQRQPLRLAVVVDRSGSMSGEPLAEALRCTEYIAAGLQGTDRLAVVLYDNTVQVPLPLAPAGNPAAVRAALAGVRSGGNTALFDGWETGARCLEGGSGDAITRVLLLSDGQANEGLCDPQAIQQHCARWAARGVTTTTVGLGRHFNEELMIGMARAGSGQHYYGQTAEDLHDSFDQELALLQSLLLRRLRVKLLPGNGVVPEPLGIVQPAGPSSYALSDLAWDAEAWMLVRLHVAPGAGAAPDQPQALLAAVLEAEQEGGAVLQLDALLSLPPMPASDLRGLPVDATVAQRLQEVEFAVAAGRIHELLSQGEVAKARAAIGGLQAQVADHPWLVDKVAVLKELAEHDVALSAKEVRYSMAHVSRRLAAVSEPQYAGSETDSFAVPSFLRRKSSEGKGRKREA